ncbi:hypothetical protein T4B_8798 [Trichinella pseudospiralis]|uniref:Uncharacterized protein n=1 Tax=Trichinella pseudospiralis TaxID=6337 RepID=A0A0V1IDY0_TRIPS|nr:hypothetical protein T4B_8798 [Trichinella pseudospiralis]
MTLLDASSSWEELKLCVPGTYGFGLGIGLGESQIGVSARQLAVNAAELEAEIEESRHRTNDNAATGKDSLVQAMETLTRRLDHLELVPDNQHTTRSRGNGVFMMRRMRPFPAGLPATMSRGKSEAGDGFKMTGGEENDGNHQPTD